jgi:hypothetical protein
MTCRQYAWDYQCDINATSARGSRPEADGGDVVVLRQVAVAVLGRRPEAALGLAVAAAGRQRHLAHQHLRCCFVVGRWGASREGAILTIAPPRARATAAPERLPPAPLPAGRRAPRSRLVVPPICRTVPTPTPPSPLNKPGRACIMTTAGLEGAAWIFRRKRS